MSTRILLNSTTSVDLPRLISSKLLLQANTGYGKSWALRRFLEQSFGKIQQIVLDTEGEFATLREKHDYILIGKGYEVAADPRTAQLLAHRLLQEKVSAIIDIYELDPKDREKFIENFTNALTNAPKNLWHPCIIVYDEVQDYAPERPMTGGTASCADALLKFAKKARKRGFCPVFATQRISDLSKAVVATCNNKLIGQASLDVDMKRCAAELGFTTKEQMLSLRDLEPGEFYAFGPAISKEVVKLKIGPVTTSHPDSTKVGGRIGTKVVPASEKVKKILAKLADLPREAAEEARTVAELKAEIRTLRSHRCKAAPDEASVARAVQTALRDQERRFKVREADILKGAKGLADFVADIVKRGERLLQIPTITIPPPTFIMKPVVVPPAPTPPRPSAPAAEGHPSLPKQARHILEVLCSRHPTALTRSQLATLSGVSHKSSTYANSLSTLNVAGLIQKNGDVISAAPSAFELLGSMPDAPTDPEEVRRTWKQNLPGGAARLFAALEGPYPDGLSRESLAEAAGMSPTSSSFANYLSILNTNGLITKTTGGIRLSESLFD